MGEFEREADMLVVRFSHSRLDAVRAPAFKEQLVARLDDRPTRVMIDATSLDFIDSTGLGVLVFLLKQMGEGGRIAIGGAKPAVRRLFEITRLDSVFTLSSDTEAARLALSA